MKLERKWTLASIAFSSTSIIFSILFAWIRNTTGIYNTIFEPLCYFQVFLLSLSIIGILMPFFTWKKAENKVVTIFLALYGLIAFAVVIMMALSTMVVGF